MKQDKHVPHLRYGSAAAFGRAVAGYYDSITCRRPKREWVDTGERSAKGKPVPEERIMTDERGNTLYETVYLTPPTLPGLCLYLGLDSAAWAACAAGEHGRGIQEACRRAMLRQEAYLLEKLLDSDRGATGIFGILDRYHCTTGETQEEVDVAQLLKRLAQSMPLTEKLQLTAGETEDEPAHD